MEDADSKHSPHRARSKQQRSEPLKSTLECGACAWGQPCRARRAHALLSTCASMQSLSNAQLPAQAWSADAASCVRIACARGGGMQIRECAHVRRSPLPHPELPFLGPTAQATGAHRLHSCPHEVERAKEPKWAQEVCVAII